ncbi:hypothetical protein GUJ93_ZPchr0002g23684 [Zizania palustris]|uniref:Uncharacterized protein n=1 Tax=Zizania palustris TaxID=103762 RepID=A0A8J5VW70_ZIZPA|nr:hypothetical protein GUJ93_ZPchr0002g23684 [Zizania palustris]
MEARAHARLVLAAARGGRARGRRGARRRVARRRVARRRPEAASGRRSPEVRRAAGARRPAGQAGGRAARESAGRHSDNLPNLSELNQRRFRLLQPPLRRLPKSPPPPEPAERQGNPELGRFKARTSSPALARVRVHRLLILAASWDAEALPPEIGARGAARMGYLPSSLGSKAAHFVSDLTTVILNPISEREPSSPLPVRSVTRDPPPLVPSVPS